MDLKTIKELYDLTGKNIIFELDDPKKSDPIVWQALIWVHKRIKEPTIKFEDIIELKIEEMVEAYKYFFRSER